MSSSTSKAQTTPSRWQRWCVNQEVHWKRGLLIVGLIACLVPFFQIWVEQRGDFKLHYEFARRLWHGELIYYGGHDTPYPPFWAVVHLPCLLVTSHQAQLILYPLFFIAFALLVYSLGEVVKQQEATRGLPHRSLFWVVTIATVLTSRFLIRDMTECGVNLLLVAGAWWALVRWQQGHDKSAGIILGLLTALKCTPALFIAWFVWKRQWELVGAASVTIFVCMLTPLLWMEPALYVETMHYWVLTLFTGMGTADPSQGVLGVEPLQNISLKPAIGRFFMHLPEGHVARMEHPLYFDFLNLGPVWAGRIAWLTMGGLLALILTRIPRQVTNRTAESLPWEFALGSVLILLYSPITWGQHCVGLFPFFFLAGYEVLYQRKGSFALAGAVGFYILVNLVLNRGLIGKDLTWIIDSYHLPTFSMLLFVPFLLKFRAEAVHAIDSDPALLSEPTQTEPEAA
ncbi:glycosyltransferase family 87 protein [Polystyrenella longa]|nr:glycosyltransferase family 87 protein [Polystyrenella longa]